MVLSESFVAYHLSEKLATLANVLSLQIFCPLKIFASKSKFTIKTSRILRCQLVGGRINKDAEVEVEVRDLRL